jgi:hypothetical protein
MVDLIPVEDVALDDTLRVAVDDVKDQLSIAGHRWAVDTATPLRMVTTSDPVEPVVLQVAAPAALVATKAHALLDRCTKGKPKMGSDLVDLLALCGQHGDEIPTELRHAPRVLTDAVVACLRSVLADEVRLLRVVRTARALVPGLAPDAVEERLPNVLPT